ncbi:chromatin modification-related protein EAF7-domain-containing protein [Collybia nuda]|uniref:Chromatin modification-related protein EAF7-domain-containing protein n=1 Tax=Collybia nuda TaxID=64659 RepID=A0A9P5YAN1_9AGAR|nr:chromatin modification-related protein EAF7-domain-containing protein [Collybia nuda]
MTVTEDDTSFLSSVEGEIAFFRSIMRARPVGIHRHFHMLTIQHSIHKETGRVINVDEIWKKLKNCYDMDALEAIDLEAEGYEVANSKKSTPISIRSPSPSANLSAHPFFREEFSLPFEESFERLISQRRMRATVSIPSSSPAPSPARPKGRGGKKRGRTKLSMAGLVGGDSDSSALTQESGDEIVGTPKGSVVTGTDGGTDYGDEEDAEMREPSPAPSASPKPIRGRAKSTKKAGTGTRGKATTVVTSGSARAVKKRKR